MTISRATLARWVSIFGPGTLVMLADSDAGSLILSAQSGASWGYSLLLLQVILIPVLYLVQELTVRLGIITGKGQVELIHEHFGSIWASIMVSMLVICCIGALLTELAGLVAVGELFNISPWKTMLVVVIFLTLMTLTHAYKSVERIAILFGSFEIIFIALAFQVKPNVSEIKSALFHFPWHEGDYIYLIAGNIGAIIMPWMIFFQQSAVLDKGLTVSDLKRARLDTALGAVVTQIIMCSVLILTAVALSHHEKGLPLTTVKQIYHAFMPILGTSGVFLFALAIAGAAFVATIVVTLTAVWGIGEMVGFRRSLGDSPKNAPWFYGIYTLILSLSAISIAYHGKNLVSISVGIEVLNALLLPIILFFLFYLAYKVLPSPYRLTGWYAWLVGVILCLTAGIGFFGGIIGFWLR